MAATRPGLFNALPDFAFFAVFLVTWIAPLTLGDQMVTWLLLVMLMEFIVIRGSRQVRSHRFHQDSPEGTGRPPAARSTRKGGTT